MKIKHCKWAYSEHEVAFAQVEEDSEAESDDEEDNEADDADDQDDEDDEVTADARKKSPRAFEEAKD